MIEVTNLSKSYGPRLAIDHLSFHIGAGEVVGFLGPNGAGKSTTMKILTGFMPASSGTARVAGYDVFEEPLNVKRNVGYLPETPPVYLEMTVEDFIEYAAKLRGVSKESVASMSKVAIDKTGLGDVRGRLIGNLSKGYRQRVGLAQAIVHNPKVLILDEPTVGLDPRQIIEIRELIRSLAGAHTVVLSTHIMQEVTQTCERIIIISKGKIVAQDKLTSLMGQTNFTLVVRTPKPDGIEALRSIKGVKNLVAAGPRILVETESSANDVREAIVETAVHKGMGVQEFSSGKASLEDIFLKVTSE